MKCASDCSFLSQQQNNTSSLYYTAYDVDLKVVPNTQFWQNKTSLTTRDPDAKPLNKLLKPIHIQVQQ